jgi:hypothetical protein
MGQQASPASISANYELINRILLATLIDWVDRFSSYSIHKGKALKHSAPRLEMNKQDKQFTNE